MKFTEIDRKQIKYLLNKSPLKDSFAATNENKPIPIVNIETISNNVWLFLRALLGIGGSECAGLFNQSQYTNPAKIYGNMVGFV